MLNQVLSQAIPPDTAISWTWVVTGAGMLTLLLGLVGLVVWFSRKIHQWVNTPATFDATQSLLTQMREARGRGEIEEEEYRNIRAHLTQTLHGIYLKDEHRK